MCKLRSGQVIISIGRNTPFIPILWYISEEGAIEGVEAALAGLERVTEAVGGATELVEVEHPQVLRAMLLCSSLMLRMSLDTDALCTPWKEVSNFWANFASSVQGLPYVINSARLITCLQITPTVCKHA
jgi:hypothetical protein